MILCYAMLCYVMLCVSGGFRRSIIRDVFLQDVWSCFFLTEITKALKANFDNGRNQQQQRRQQWRPGQQ